VLLDKGDALIYFEPESLVMSRTGDEVLRVDLFILVFPAFSVCLTVHGGALPPISELV
jgi:hypothetical protein